MRVVPMSRSWAACATAALLGLAGAACERQPPPRAPKDVLLVTLDTARADRFSYAGAPGPGTPRIDALAAEGAGFANAISPAPLTKPAHASIFTGRLPPSHTVRDNGAYRLPESETTLAEVLRAAGYATGAFIGAQVLDSRYGFDQGFDTYDDDIPDAGDSALLTYGERRGGDVVAAATRWLDTVGAGPVFAWVHLFDPHAPYRPPEPERSRYRSAYDGEIAYVDRLVGELLDAWSARRDLTSTLVVVTADHGEALGEHDEATHGILVHEATLRVPLVVRAPGLRAGGPIEAAVGLVDVLPTVMALLRLPVPAGVQGRDLGPLLRGEAVDWSPHSGYSESLYAQLHHGCAPLRSVRRDGWKLVRGSAVELFDLGGDPGEIRDLAGSEAGRVGVLSTVLDGLVRDLETGAAETEPLDEEARRVLESLGYVWTAAPRTSGDAGPRDPREALGSERRMADADRAALRGDLGGAVAAYRAEIAREPAGIVARVRLSHLLVSRGRSAEALPLLAAAVAMAPDEPALSQKLGEAYDALDRHHEALAAFDAGLARHPSSLELRTGRWRCLNHLGRFGVLLDEAELAVRQDPADGVARHARALACCGRLGLEAYVGALERELAELPGDRTLTRALARARSDGGQESGEVE